MGDLQTEQGEALELRFVPVSEFARLRANAADPVARTAAYAALARIKELEAQGLAFEGAEGSFELLIHRRTPGYAAPFRVIDYTVLSELRDGGGARVVEGAVRPDDLAPIARAQYPASPSICPSATISMTETAASQPSPSICTRSGEMANVAMIRSTRLVTR